MHLKIISWQFLISIGYLCIASCAFALDSDDVPDKCKNQKDLMAVAKNLADDRLGKFDKACKGYLTAAEKQEADSESKKLMEQKLIAYYDGLQQIARKNRGQIPPQEVRSKFRLDPEPDQPAFLVRDAYTPYTITNRPKPFEKAEGAQLSYARDYLDSNEMYSASGSIIGYRNLSLRASKDNPFAGLGVTNVVMAPAIEFDRQINRNDPKKNTDYLAFRYISEFEHEPTNSFIWTQYFRNSFYVKSDFAGRSSILGGDLEWEPYFGFATGAAYLIPGTPVQFRWQPILHAEAERVVDQGKLTNISTGDSYFRAGPILSSNIWFYTDGPLRSLALEFQYRYLQNFSSAGHDADLKYFQGTVAYNFDKSGHYALSIVYRDGDLPGNGSRARDIRTGLTVKY